MWVCDPSVAGRPSQSDTSTLSIIVHIPFPLPYYSRHETILVSEIFQFFIFFDWEFSLAVRTCTSPYLNSNVVKCYVHSSLD